MSVPEARSAAAGNGERLLTDLAPLDDPLWLVVDDVHGLGPDAVPRESCRGEVAVRDIPGRRLLSLIRRARRASMRPKLVPRGARYSGTVAVTVP